MCSPNIDIRAAEAELARRCYYEFVLQTKSDYIGGWFLRKVADALQRFYHEVEAGKRPRMMIFAPPRSGKSELFSRRFPAWALGKNPDMQFISCSYADDLAGRTNRDVQRIIDTPKYMSIFPGTRLNVRNVSTYSQGAYLRNSDLFEIPGHTGSYRSAGIGGGITGMGADIAVIDDPVKDKAQAGSKTWRDAIWDWYRSVLYSRLSPKGGVLLGMTRWHEDDLAGRLLDAAMAGADKWEVLKFPATAEEDEEHRKAGEPLHPERFSAEQLAEIKRVQGSDSWAALYQQRPAPVGGGIFDRAWWRFWKPDGMELPPVRMTGSDGSTHEAICIPLPAHADEMIESWDCTFKDTASADFVAGHLWARVGGDAFLIDREHARMNFPTTLAAVRAMSARWPGATAKLIEDTANGPAIIQTLAHEVPGILPIRPMGGKVSRANAVAPMVEAGNVYLPHPAVKPWVNEFIEEASNFPQAAHDDDVDAMTQALSRLSQQTLSLESYGTWATPMPSISAF